MPYSHPVFDRTVARFLREQSRKRYLDVGAGAAKYGRIIRKSVFPCIH